METELNFDPDPELITDPDPNLQIISDPAGSGAGWTALEGNQEQIEEVKQTSKNESEIRNVGGVAREDD